MKQKTAKKQPVDPRASLDKGHPLTRRPGLTMSGVAWAEDNRREFHRRCDERDAEKSWHAHLVPANAAAPATRAALVTLPTAVADVLGTLVAEGLTVKVATDGSTAITSSGFGEGEVVARRLREIGFQQVYRGGYGAMGVGVMTWFRRDRDPIGVDNPGIPGLFEV